MSTAENQASVPIKEEEKVEGTPQIKVEETKTGEVNVDQSATEAKAEDSTEETSEEKAEVGQSLEEKNDDSTAAPPVAAPADEGEENKAIEEETQAKKDEEESKKKADEEKKLEEEASEKEAEEAAKIKALEKELADLEAEVTQLEEKKAALPPVTDEQKEASKTQLKEATEKHSEVMKAYKEAEQDKFEVQPRYEQCLDNKEQKERAATLNADIEAAEKKVKNDEAKVAGLDETMAKVSADYSTAKDALERFTKDLGTQLLELQKATAEKIDMTIAVTPESSDDTEEIKQHRDTVTLATLELLDALEGIVREREREIHHASRQLREVKAILEMKAEEEANLNTELGDASGQKQKENDDYIKGLIYSFQDIRSNLQADIEEIKKVNQEQAYNLRRGHVEKPSDERSTFSTDTGRGKSAATPNGGRQSSFRRDAKPTREQQQMKERNEELQTDLNTVKKRLAEAVTNRTEGLKTLKGLRARVARDEERFREELREMDSRIAAETYAVETQELENKRLAEAVEHLTFVVQSTRQQVTHIRTHKDPLPIEENE